MLNVRGLYFYKFNPAPTWRWWGGGVNDFWLIVGKVWKCDKKRKVISLYWYFLPTNHLFSMKNHSFTQILQRTHKYLFATLWKNFRKIEDFLKGGVELIYTKSIFIQFCIKVVCLNQSNSINKQPIWKRYPRSS